MSALAVATSKLAMPNGEFSSGTHALRIFDRVPSGHDVVPLCGMVAVSHPKWLEMVEGGFYVVETQHPPGGMVWQTYDEHVQRYDMDGGPRTLLKTSRRVIRAVRREATGDAWWFIHESGFADGPIKAWAVGHNVVGEVVGIYRP
ncbi:hypothetical protein I5L01_09305 [Erythrobacter sp. YJ-T3-07]|uniref:hypothetical protein n=1 Tax=Erythrobacter sp. YJ-T3-07 TaxID=2793063 RepID=UPI0018D2CBAB|nr:hypothetical protein [Erythrobacter sp. YJ-T3-07]MBH1944429.1 hypothetical protein [Erythrobacter sp. YJ-T3-07]